MGSERIKPSRWYYGMAAVVCIVGFAMFYETLMKGLNAVPSMVQQFAAPGNAELALPNPGEYTVFYEYQSVMGNRTYSTGLDVPDLRLSVVSKDTGSAVKLRPSGVNTTYSFERRAGRSLFDFNIDKPGVYQFKTRYAKGQQGEEVAMAVGQGVPGVIMKTVFMGLSIAFATLGLTFVIVLVTAIKRHNAAKRLRTPGGPPPPIE